MRKLICLVTTCLLLDCSIVAAQTADAVETFTDWTAYTAEAGGKKICFASSAPKVTLPKGANRGKILFYVSIWTGEGGVRDEISVKVGYPLKPGSISTVEIGSEKFSLFVENDRAFVEKTEDEKRLSAAMRKGSLMIVKGVSARGTQTLDRYSLNGVSAALDRIAKECP